MTCTPADVVRALEALKRREAARSVEVALRTLSWNKQMQAAMAVIIAADCAGHGVIIRVSHARNTIEAVPHEVAERGTAYIFDYDRPDSGPFRKRLHIQITPAQKD